MRTLRAGIAILAAVALSVSAQAAERPKTIYVEGDDLQDAIDKAPPHSVLLADRGRQIEISATVRITKPVTLVGLNARLKPGLGKTPILEVLAEGFRIRDFLLEGNADSVEQKQRAPLIVIRRGRFVVENGETNNSAKDGVMITPVAEYGDIEHGVIRDLTSRGTIRDTVSIGGAGDLGLFVRHLVVSNIRAYDSELRGPAEVSDGSEYITVRDIYAESCAYGIDVQDHNRPGQTNRYVIIDGLHVKNCQTAIRTANRDFGHDGLTIRNVSGTGWTGERWAALDIRNTSNVLIENVRIRGCAAQGAVRIRNSDNVTVRNLTVSDCDYEGAALLVEDASRALFDNILIEGSAQPKFGVLYRVGSNETFRGLRIRDVAAESVRGDGIVLENTSESGKLESYRITDSQATVRADAKLGRGIVRGNLPSKSRE